MLQKENILWLLLFCPFFLIIPLVFFKAEIGFDEAYNLQIPKNLVRFGEYKIDSPDVFSIADNFNSVKFPPMITTGPTVLYPVALFFKIFSIDLWQARLVMLLYFLTFLLTFYFFTKFLFSKKIALISLFLLLFCSLLFDPIHGDTFGTSLVTGVLGETPGLVFLILGLYFFAKKRDFLFGFCFGLAAITKPQHFVFGITVVAFIILSLLSHIFSQDDKKRLKKALPHFLIGFFLLFFGWRLFVYWQIGSSKDIFLRLLEEKIQSRAYETWHPLVLVRNLKNFFDFGIIPILIFSIYGIFLSLKNQKKNLLMLLTSLLILAHFFTWFFNLWALNRHFLPAILLANIFSGKMIVDLFNEQKRTFFSRVILGFIIFFLLIQGLANVDSIARIISLKSSSKKQIALELKNFLKNREKTVLFGWQWWLAPEVAFFLDKPIYNAQKFFKQKCISDNCYFLITPYEKFRHQDCFDAAEKMPILGSELKSIVETEKDFLDFYSIKKYSFSSGADLYLLKKPRNQKNNEAMNQ